jgi:hypothetical protein
MGKKNKKKRVRDRLAKKRGSKKPKRKIPPPKSKRKITEETLNRMMLATLPLSSLEELRDVSFSHEKVDAYLKKAKDEEETEPILFMRKGIEESISPEFLTSIKDRLLDIADKKGTAQQLLVSIDAYFRLLGMGVHPAFIPFFMMLFARQVKEHPLSDDPKIWKYIVDFLPKKVVSPDEEQTIVVPGKEQQQQEEQDKKDEDKRDERYPHIILPK